MAELQRGVVKWFNDAKGFGFIEHTSGKDVFVHYSVIEWDGFKTLKDGEEVIYELKEGEKGLHAAKVVRSDAQKKKAEKEQNETAERSDAGMIAPKLESGAVNTEIRTNASMIEVEKQETSSISPEAIADAKADKSSVSVADRQ